mmetsp:Transcript_86626/g.129889  ORF Transcript_86626/g.129889 Transcript_86626/m.129889 type:complete len:214 (+) Transcript_86626:32-673(+)
MNDPNLTLEPTAIRGRGAVKRKNGVVEQTVVERQLLTSLVLLSSGNEAAVGGLLRRLATVRGDVTEGNQNLVAGTVGASAPAVAHQGVEAPEELVTSNGQDTGVVRLDQLLVLVVELVERAAHLDSQVVCVLAARATKELAELGISQRHDVLVRARDDLHVGEPERVLVLVLVHDVQQHAKVRVHLLVAELAENVANLRLESGLLVQTEGAGE